MPAADVDTNSLMADLKRWSAELGFARLGVAKIDLSADEAFFRDWLQAGFHGEMSYMARHEQERRSPQKLLPGTVTCISVRMDYWPQGAADSEAILADGDKGYVSRYAVGGDYHKFIRKRLQRLCDRIVLAVGPFGYRAFSDSAPVLEKALARNAGLGWIGKHTNLIDRDSGSYFFLGEIFLDLDLPADEPATAHCGSCSACLPACPTGAIVAPYRLDARRCISYLTIELKGPIPTEFRRAVGNRIYGCDDCQLVCPWNKFARPTRAPHFAPRHELDRAGLVDLFRWTEAEFMTRLEGSAIRRIGHERWLRNLAVALGNAPRSAPLLAALQERAAHPSAMVREHVAWALAQHASTGR